MTELQMENSLTGDVDANVDADTAFVKSITSTTTTTAASKAKAKRRQFVEGGEPEEGFLSTSPDSANGDAHAHSRTHTHTHSHTHTLTHTHAQSLQQASDVSNGEPLSARQLLLQAFFQCKNHHQNNKNNKNSCAEDRQCVSLASILDCFKAPVSEDRAWALIYQFTALYLKVATQAVHCSSDEYAAQLPDRFELHLHRDGSVHFSGKEQQQQQQPPKLEQQLQLPQEEQLQPASLPLDDSASSSGDSSVVIDRAFDNNNQHTPFVSSHRKIICELAEVVYAALDYNFGEDDECQLSEELENLFHFMTADENDDDCIDEGIEEGDKRWDDETEEERNNTKDLEHIIETCKNHIKPALPENHYKAVCRALVTETIELRVFLQKVLSNNTAKVTESYPSTQYELAKLGFSDWACFWVQVIDELRRGVRLKKRNYERTPIEYELTPYEILMGDIRAKKYQLRKVMVNGDIPPRVKKDAHAMILEFIRSRPPLKKASERQLGPPMKCTPSLREQLMESIRQGKELKQITPPKVPTLKEKLLPNSTNSTLMGSRQRLIKVDFSKLQDDEHIFDESSISSCTASTAAGAAHLAELHRYSQPKMPPYPIGGYMLSSQARHESPAMLMRPRRTTYDLATQSDAQRASVRRHTIVGCQSNLDETHSMPPTRPESRQSDDVSLNSKELLKKSPETTQSLEQHQQQERQERQHHQQQPPSRETSGVGETASHSTSSLGPWNKSFMDKQTWMERGDDRLSVTLAEIVHIRSVMTKAELESLPMDVRVKEDVEKRRVCFLCLRTRFSFFGPSGIQCKLCQRTVCAKCYTKMRIPSEHFRNVPLVLISPSLLSSPASSSTPSPSHHAAHYSAHSSSTGNIMDDQFPKTLIERLLRSESDRKTRSTVGSAPSSPKHQRSNMSTPGISVGPGSAAGAAAAGTGQAVEALHDQASMSASYSAAMRPSGMHQYQQKQQQQQNYNNAMSRSMEGPRSLPVQSPAYRPLSNSSTLERKSRFSRGFALFSSGSHLAQTQQDQKENLRGEQVTVCNDCQGLVNEITSSVKQKRSSARNRTIQNLTLDLTPVWK